MTAGSTKAANTTCGSAAARSRPKRTTCPACPTASAASPSPSSPACQRPSATTPVARLETADRERLERLLTGAVSALPLGPDRIAARVLDKAPDAPGVQPFIAAAATLRHAASFADIRHATDLVAQSAVEMGLDRFIPFLRAADATLAERGPVILARQTLPAPPVAPPPTRPPAPAPGAGGRMGGALGALAALGTAAELLQRLTQMARDAQVAAVIERFKLDPNNPADVMAAAAYRWAQDHGPWAFREVPQTGPEMMQMAERVLRAVQADPSLAVPAANGDKAAIETLRQQVEGEAVPGSGIETRNGEENDLVAFMIQQGKSGTEIQAALEALRNGPARTSEERRNQPGVFFATSDGKREAEGWLQAYRLDPNGAPLPAQIIESLSGRPMSNWKQARGAIWEAIASNEELRKEFGLANKNRMERGLAPFAPLEGQADRGGVFELHHYPPLGEGGALYDLSAIRIVTPLQHEAIHRRN